MMIAILLPAFNEANALERLLPALPDRLGGLDVRALVISDGSTDGTPDVARAHGIAVLELWPNRGKGAALRAGLDAVQVDAPAGVVLMDADGQHDPGQLTRLVEPVLAGDCDIACGSRYLIDSGRGETPLNRYLVRRVVIWSLRRRLDVRVTDPFCGYRCLAPAVAAIWRPDGDRYQAELELLFDAAAHGWSMWEVAVTRSYVGHFTKMGALSGPMRGRLQVLAQYAATFARRSNDPAMDRGDTDLTSRPKRSDERSDDG